MFSSSSFQNAEAGPSSASLSNHDHKDADHRQQQRPALSSPSSNSTHASPPPPLFLPPQAPHHPTHHLTSTQDLLARFSLLAAYDKYVGPGVKAAPSHDPQSTAGNGKGKERERDTSPNRNHSPGPDAADVDDDDAQPEEKKKKNNYKHLIKGIPGKHSMKKDDYLTTIMGAPPKQRIPITPFDARTQREAFSISLEGLKGWNPSALILESAQAREDRKKRKELKRLAKAQQAQILTPNQPSNHPQNQMPNQAQATQQNPHHPSPSIPPPMSAGPPKPSHAPTLPPLQKVLPASSLPSAGYTASPTTQNGPPTPRFGNHSPVHNTTGPTPATPLHNDPARGKKREHSVALGGAGSNANAPNNVGGNGSALPSANSGMNGVVGNGGTGAGARPVPVGAKAGTANVRPRPLKKQRVGIQGQARDVSTTVQQQPTPQGV